MDYGVKIEGDQVHFPEHVAPKDLDAVFLTHAHLDHSGAVPILFTSSRPPRLYASEPTYEQMEILMNDMIKLNKYNLPFGEGEVNRAIEMGERVSYNDTLKIKDAEIEIIDAGHIPGSYQVVIKADKTLLYVGDFTTTRTKLLDGAEIPKDGFDVVITESTYALEEHRPRKELERSVVNELYSTVSNGGIAVVPAFSVMRSQEVACILHSYGFKERIWMDGMATKVLELYLRDHYKEFIDGWDLLSKTARRVNYVKGRRHRERVLSNPGVIISPAGMLKGGPVLHYVKSVATDPNSSITLVSFQDPLSPGFELLNHRRVVIDNLLIDVKCNVQQIKLSAHAGMSGLHEYISKVCQNGVVYCVHGEPESCRALAEWVGANTSATGYAPNRGETVIV